MKKTLTKVWLFGALGAAAALLFMGSKASAQGDKVTLAAAIAPTTPVAALTTVTTTADLGVPVAINYDKDITLFTSLYEATNSAATGGNVTYTFVTSVDGSTWEAAPKLSWVLKSLGTNSTTKTVARTNFTVGAMRWLKLESIANACSNAVVQGTIYVNQVPR